MVIEGLIFSRNESEIKKWSRSHKNLVMNIQPVLPTNKYITHRVWEHHQLHALLTAGTPKVRPFFQRNIVFQTFISVFSLFAFIFGGVSPLFGHIPIGNKNKPATPVVPEPWQDDGKAFGHANVSHAQPSTRSWNQGAWWPEASWDGRRFEGHNNFNNKHA